MKNIIIVTSIIDTPNNLPLSYSLKRSVFFKKDRFEQTKNTISSIRLHIPDCLILLIECSPLDNNEAEFFTNNTDIFINMYNDDKINEFLINIYSPFKALAEGTMTIYALEYLFNNNIICDNIFKISGRYYLNDNFHFDNYLNNDDTIYKIDNKRCNTCFYKLTFNNAFKWLLFLKNEKILMSYKHLLLSRNSFEDIFCLFAIKNNIKLNDHNHKIGISGNVSVCGSYVEL
jgi:hypothetical protein